MSEWWTYEFSDFLMFAPATYWRLVELYNRDLWPASLLAGGAGLAAWIAVARRPEAGERFALFVLAAAWCWVAWAFFWERLAQIHLAAPYLAGAAALQGALLAAIALLARGAQVRPAPAGRRIAGLVVALVATVMFPWAGLLAGRPLAQAEVFGWMPDPTALASLGLVLAVGGLTAWQRVLLGTLPVLFLLAGGINHASMAQ